MKKLLNILFTFLVTCVVAQVPQGIGYQGVATDASGVELVNQAISIRASVLSGSATGTIEWEETHATTTDTFGLFTLTIGQGTSTANGAQTNFADISWGTNTHFLKIEMDVTGGSNYSFMGTNQMMSVPYALYAESANINYDSISNLLSNDSTFITTVGGGIGGGGCDFNYPDGLDGNSIVIKLLSSSTYTVPTGKNLYITSFTAINNHDTQELLINSLTIFRGKGYNNPTGDKNDHFSLPIICASNDVISTYDANSNQSEAVITGILIDQNVTPTTYSGNYIVPNGKKLIVLNYFSDAWSPLEVDGETVLYGFFNVYSQASLAGPTETRLSIQIPLIFEANSNVNVPTTGLLNGYLVDENYFAGCGGGGSSTSSSLDSTTIANMIQNTTFNSTLLSNDICIDADTAILIDVTNFQNGITSIAMDDSSNVYVALTDAGFQSWGGEVRKYDSNLNLIWTKSWSTETPNKLVYHNGGLFVSGIYGYAGGNQANGSFVKRLDLQSGNELWHNYISTQSGFGDLLECNDNYVCIISFGYNSNNFAYITTFDFNSGVVINNHVLSAGYPFCTTIDNNIVYVRTNNQIHTFDILSSSNSPIQSIGVSGTNVDFQDMLCTQGKFLRNFYAPTSTSSLQDAKLYLYSSNLTNIGTTIDYPITTGATSGAGPHDQFHAYPNGFSFLLNSSRSNVNVLGQCYLQNYNYATGNYVNSFAIVDLDINFNVVSVKNLISLSEMHGLRYGTSSSGKHCVSFVSSNNTCINGISYSGVTLLIY